MITPAERPDNRAQRYVMAGQIFTLQSNVFRIYGDGLYQNKMIRIEAYVFRNPMESGDFNNPGMNPNLNPANNKTNQQNLSRNTPRTNNNSTTVQNQGGLPPEPFRILDWKIIK